MLSRRKLETYIIYSRIRGPAKNICNTKEKRPPLIRNCAIRGNIEEGGVHIFKVNNRNLGRPGATCKGHVADGSSLAAAARNSQGNKNHLKTKASHNKEQQKETKARNIKTKNRGKRDGDMSACPRGVTEVQGSRKGGLAQTHPGSEGSERTGRAAAGPERDSDPGCV